jgi:hypothetical protein
MSEKKVILIFGKRGSGKSFLAKRLISKELRFIIFDTIGEYNQGVIFGTEQYDQLMQFWQRTYRRPFRLVYQPIDPDAEIELIAELIYTLGNVTFVVEEIDCFCGSHQIAFSFKQIIQRGRHKNITLIGITQRPFGIHRLLTSQAKELYIFNTNEPRDREYLCALLGQGISEKLDQLKQYEFLHWQDGQDEIKIEKAQAAENSPLPSYSG